MRRRLMLLCVSLALIVIGGHPRAQGPAAAFFAIGDLPGGGFTTVIRDATQAGGGISAVGGAVSRRTCIPAGQTLPVSPCPRTDTAVLWRFDGSSSALTALPDPVVNTSELPRSAYAITPDGVYVAAQARVPFVTTSTSFVSRATRVTTIGLSVEDIVPTLNGGVAAAIASANPSILYGFSVDGFNQPTTGRRFDAATNTQVFIPRVCPAASAQCPAADTANPIAERGASADGDFAVGSSYRSAITHKAYRYQFSSGVVTQIPFLPGGTYNDALAISPSGNLVLVSGDSAENPNGEAYLYDFDAPAGAAVTRLGSPNAAWGPGGRWCTVEGGCQPTVFRAGGMTTDGSVVAMSFHADDGQTGYFRNAAGWFHLTSALGASGIDISQDGWDLNTLLIQGISSDGTLVFGAGARNGNTTGFVSRFAPGFLAAFNPQAAPPPDKSLVGLWTFSESGPDNADSVVFFTDDGAYYHVEGGPGDALAGFERGLYTFAGGQFALTTLVDTNGSAGLSSDTNGVSFGPAAVVGDTLDVGGQVVARRIKGGPSSIVGGWVLGDATQRDNSVAVAFIANGRYFLALDGAPQASADSRDSIETGTWSWDGAVLVVDSSVGVDTNADGGLSDPMNAPSAHAATLSADERGFVIGSAPDAFQFTRVIDPRTPAITSASIATATTGLPFAYQITATGSPSHFDVSGVPAGLSANTTTGVISGVPTVTGTFDIRLEASNALSTTIGVNRLTLVVLAPVVVPTGPAVVTPIPPAAPGEVPPVTLEFSNVTSGGTISVATVDPEAASAPDPPAGFSLGDPPVYYEITPSANLTFTGTVEVCFSYAGVTFAGVPRLLHYDTDLASWIDITRSLDTATSTVCGLTASFSPFAIAESALAGVGFHQPVEPVAGAVNTVKGGSTVALKFNVYAANGVEITSAAGISNLAFRVVRVSCQSQEQEDDVPFQSTGETSLRYADGAFIQNWKTPKTVGACYLVKLTGDGLLLTARFRVK